MFADTQCHPRARSICPGEFCVTRFTYRAFIGRRLDRNAIHGYYHVACDSDDAISLSDIEGRW